MYGSRIDFKVYCMNLMLMCNMYNMLAFFQRAFFWVEAFVIAFFLFPDLLYSLTSVRLNCVIFASGEQVGLDKVNPRFMIDIDDRASNRHTQSKTKCLCMMIN